MTVDLRMSNLRALYREKPLQKEDWVGLLEECRKFLKPHLASFTLPELGELRCMATEDCLHRIDLDKPIVNKTGVISSHFGLQVRGIFYPMWEDVKNRPADGKRVIPILGLVRPADWVLVTVKSQFQLNRRCYEKAMTVEINELPLPIIISKTKTSPCRLFANLETTTNEWVSDREGLYKRALEVSELFGVIRAITSNIPG